jgi:hypothetical protein
MDRIGLRSNTPSSLDPERIKCAKPGLQLLDALKFALPLTSSFDSAA